MRAFSLPGSIPQALFVGAVLLLSTVSPDATAQDRASWHFKYYAGDPASWLDHPSSTATKAECEIARAEVTTKGYPVGDCYGLPALSTSKTTTSTTTSSKAKAIEAERQRKLAKGCRIGCEDTHTTCQQAIPSQSACIQVENTRCIERCTSVEGLPHHQCINEICLPNEINMATWEGACESSTERAQQSCDAEQTTCLKTCGSP